MANLRYCAVGKLVDSPDIPFIMASYSAKVGKADDKSLPNKCAAFAAKLLNSGRLADQPKLTVTDRDVGSVHYDCDKSHVFLVITAEGYPQRTAFKFLEELKSQFMEKFGEAIPKAKADGLTRKAKPLLSDLCARYYDAENMDKVTAVQAEVDKVKIVMNENIDQMIATKENLEVLEDKTQNLQEDAKKFQRQARGLKRNMWWKNLKMQIALCVLVVGILAGILIPVVIHLTPRTTSDGSEE